ncbi:two pore domain potassium channel family protein [Candidatus Peribacteria bacterium]|nr:two pore domain potassium channel family protein [Candidatus Peribacteria bacterium]
MHKNKLPLIEKIFALPYSALGILWGGLVVLFACAYFALGQWLPSHAPYPIGTESILQSLGDSIYFSVITATTVGYGDILPQGLSKLLAAIQAIVAFFVFGLCISKLVSSKQEVAIRQMHKLTFEDVFRNTREGLYIVRKDIDHVLAQAEAHRRVDEEHWENLAVALKQAESLIVEIPEFYASGSELYVIDERREELLQEAVHRTLHRINQMLDRFAALGIDWQGRGIAELGPLLTIVAEVAAHWKSESPYAQHEAFDDILTEANHTRGKMGHIV